MPVGDSLTLPDETASTGSDRRLALPALRHMASQWPGIVAHECQRLLDELQLGNVAGATWQLIDCAEVICKFITVAMVMDLRAHAPEAADPLLDALFQRRHLSFGAWQQLAMHAGDAVLAQAGNTAGTPLLAPELGGMLARQRAPGRDQPRSSKLGATMQAMVQYRNQTRGHGAYGADLDAEAREVVERIRQLDDGLAQAALAWPEDLQLATDTGPRELLMGALPWRQRHSDQKFAHAPDAHAMDQLPLALVRAGRRLRLSPLVTLRRCRQCGLQEAFVYDSGEQGGGQASFFLLDYLSGHRLTLRHFDDLSLRDLADRPLLATVAQAHEVIGDTSIDTALKDLLLATDVDSRLQKPAYLLGPILDFLDAHDRGLLLVEAPGQVGKSVAMAALEKEVRNGGGRAVVRFAAKKGINYGALQLDLLLDQKLRDQLGRETLQGEKHLLPRLQPMLASRGGLLPRQVMLNYLADLMNSPLAAKFSGGLVLIIDGLDELQTTPGAVAIHELLPEPDRLPMGCYMVLSSRPLDGLDVPPAVLGHLRDIGLPAEVPGLVRTLRVRPDSDDSQDALGSAYRKLLRQYFDDRVRPQVSAGRIGARDAGALFAVLMVKAKGRFGYLAHLSHLVEDGLLTLEQAQGLPSGEGLYDNYLDQLEQRLGQGASGKAWHSVKQLILVLVADARAFDLESEAWNQWLPKRSYRGIPLDVLARLLNQPGATYGLVWTLYAFKHLLGSWRGGSGNTTHWRLGLRDLREAVERRWGADLCRVHAQLAGSTAGGQWGPLDDFPIDDPTAGHAALAWHWHRRASRQAISSLTAEAVAMGACLGNMASRNGMDPTTRFRVELVKLDLLETPAEKDDSDDTRGGRLWETARRRIRLSHALLDMSEPEAGVVAADRSIEELSAARNLVEYLRAYEWSHDLAHAYSLRGAAKIDAPSYRTEDSIADFDEAIKRFCLAINAKDLQLQPTWREVLSSAYANRACAKGSTWTSDSATSAARDFELALETLNPVIADDPSNAPRAALYAIALIHMNRASVNLITAGGSHAEILRDYDAAIDKLSLGQTSAEEACPESWLVALAESYLGRAHIKQESNNSDRPTASDDFHSALTILRPLVDSQVRPPEPKLLVSFCRALIGNHASRQKIADHAASGNTKGLDEAIQLLQGLVEERAARCPIVWRFSLAAAYLCRVEDKKGIDNDLSCGARSDCDRAIETLEFAEQAQQGQITPELQFELARAYAIRAELGLQRGGAEVHEAIKDFNSAISRLTDLVGKSGDKTPLKWRHALANGFINRGIAWDRAEPAHDARSMDDLTLGINLLGPLTAAETAECSPNLHYTLAGAFIYRGRIAMKNTRSGAMFAAEDFTSAIEKLTTLLGEEAWQHPESWRKSLKEAHYHRSLAFNALSQPWHAAADLAQLVDLMNHNWKTRPRWFSGTPVQLPLNMARDGVKSQSPDLQEPHPIEGECRDLLIDFFGTQRFADATDITVFAMPSDFLLDATWLQLRALVNQHEKTVDFLWHHQAGALIWLDEMQASLQLPMLAKWIQVDTPARALSWLRLYSRHSTIGFLRFIPIIDASEIPWREDCGAVPEIEFTPATRCSTRPDEQVIECLTLAGFDLVRARYVVNAIGEVSVEVLDVVASQMPVLFPVSDDGWYWWQAE